MKLGILICSIYHGTSSSNILKQPKIHMQMIWVTGDVFRIADSSPEVLSDNIHGKFASILILFTHTL